jgi:hypothetical protein
LDPVRRFGGCGTTRFVVFSNFITVLHSPLRVVMTNEFAKSIDRRGFLRLGLCAGMVAAVGCGGEGAGTIEAVPKTGNKSRLENRKGIVKPDTAKKAE